MGIFDLPLITCLKPFSQLFAAITVWQTSSCRMPFGQKPKGQTVCSWECFKVGNFDIHAKEKILFTNKMKQNKIWLRPKG
jgi:hypothetical protein